MMNDMINDIAKVKADYTTVASTPPSSRVFILYAHRTDVEHRFIEVFTTTEKLDMWLSNHTNVEKDQITLFEVDPK